MVYEIYVAALTYTHAVVWSIGSYKIIYIYLRINNKPVNALLMLAAHLNHSARRAFSESNDHRRYQTLNRGQEVYTTFNERKFYVNSAEELRSSVCVTCVYVRSQEVSW